MFVDVQACGSAEPTLPKMSYMTLTRSVSCILSGSKRVDLSQNERRQKLKNATNVPPEQLGQRSTTTIPVNISTLKIVEVRLHLKAMQYFMPCPLPFHRIQVLLD